MSPTSHLGGLPSIMEDPFVEDRASTEPIPPNLMTVFQKLNFKPASVEDYNENNDHLDVSESSSSNLNSGDHKGKGKAYSPGAFGSGYGRREEPATRRYHHHHHSETGVSFGSPYAQATKKAIASSVSSGNRYLNGYWRNGSSSSKSVSIRGRATFIRREVRAGARKFDAQEYFEPSACLFIANLNNRETLTTLEYAIRDVFGQWASNGIWVKVECDSRNMPYAFVQFDNDHSADVALREAPGQIICGRPCRVERAKGSRTYALTRKDGAAFGKDEASDLLGSFGVTTQMYTTPAYQDEQDDLMSRGWLAKFQYSGHGFKAAKNLNHVESPYRMECIAAVAEPRKSSPRPVRNRSIESLLRQQDVDFNSIFVSKIVPEAADEQVLRQIFKQFGGIISVKILAHQHGHRSFYAFIEFDNPRSPLSVMESKNEIWVDHQLDVHQKRSTPSRLTRLGGHGVRNGNHHVVHSGGRNRSYFTPPSVSHGMGIMSVQRQMHPANPYHNGQGFSNQVNPGNHFQMMHQGMYTPPVSQNIQYSNGNYPAFDMNGNALSHWGTNQYNYHVQPHMSYPPPAFSLSAGNFGTGINTGTHVGGSGHHFVQSDASYN